MSEIHNGIDIEQITVSLGADCAASRKHAMELVEEQAQIPFAKKAPRIPRDSEPCPLWVFFVMAAFLVACFAVMGAEAAMAYADALIPALVMWISDVIRWVAQ